VSAQQSGDRSSFYLNHCRKTATQEATLPIIKRARSPEDRTHQPFGENVVRNCTSMKPKNTPLGAKKCFCRQCQKPFSQNSHFTKHMETHQKEDHGYQDNEKNISLASHFVTHMQTHTRKKPYCCQQCGKRFSQVGNFTTHKRMHTGEKPYCCQEYGKRFSQGSHLTTHLRTHTGEKPFRCQECGKRFSQSSNPTTHMRIHTGENLSVVRYVEKDSRATWHFTSEHILVRKLVVTRKVEKDICLLANWLDTCEWTMGKICNVASLVDKDLQDRYLQQTHSNTPKIQLIDPGLSLTWLRNSRETALGHLIAPETSVFFLSPLPS